MRRDMNQRRCRLGALIECRGLFVECGTFPEQTLSGLALGFWIGIRRVFASLDASLLLLLIEGVEVFVVVCRGGLELVVIERPEHVEPKDIGLVG